MQVRLDAPGQGEVLMLGFKTRLALAASAAWLSVGCSVSPDETHGLTATLTFDPAPRVGTVSCEVTLKDANGAPAACTEVRLEGNMNHAGMVPVFASAQPKGDGLFVSTMEFTMGGDWLIFVRGKTDDGRAFEIVSEVPGVPSRPKEAAPSEAPAK